MVDIEKKFSEALTQEKVEAVCQILSDNKGRMVLALDVRDISKSAEAMIIVSANSVRHAQGLADHTAKSVAEWNYEMLGMEGYKSGQWILMDLNDVLVHIFQADVRDFFNLEGLWSGAPEMCRMDGGTDDSDDLWDGLEDDL
ncbi:MAG: ribosome silencing factor [Desulfovibrio sp.]|nr:MAG: ribosome silencing factor [Desulfovibrio sp.]